ncbi:MAG: flagellin hook IN motif-containing protein, partial [Alphaproteobacteria bacterium]|nr:flagellin hook IN motif-containing protein [Alphaproteobacteria bacterium]
MENVTLSAAVRNNLLSLQNTATRLGKTQQRLATGLKVNSALDDPTAFFTASSLNSRASDLNRLLDSVGNAIETIRAADDGLSSITKLVQAAQATARQALQKPTTKLDNPITITGKGGQIGADKQINITGNGASLSSDRKAILQGNSDIAELVATGGTITINGTDIDIAAEATSSSVLAAINEKRETTGVSASLSVSNKLLLTGKAGKDI